MGEKLKRAGQSFVIVQYNYFGAFLLCISLVFFFAIFFSPDHLAMLAAFVISFGGGVWMLLVAQRKTDEINVQKSAEDKERLKNLCLSA